MITSNDYAAYFKNLAVQHKELDHSDDSGDNSFVRSNVWELYSGFRTKIKSKTHIMRLLSHQWRVLDSRSSNPKKVIQGGFLILGYHLSNDFNEMQNAIDSSEKIAQDIINRMKYDADNNKKDADSLFYTSMSTLNNISVDPIEVDDNYSGWMVSFEITPFYSLCVEKNNWKDL